MNSTTKKAAKRKPNDGCEPLTFKNDEIRKMSAKEEGEDLLRILIAGLQQKLGLPQTTTHPQAARPRKSVADQSDRRLPGTSSQPERPPEIYCVEKVAFPDFLQIPRVLYALPEKRSPKVARSERSSYAFVIA